MNPKDQDPAASPPERSKACWACIRRTVPCDGGRPVCRKCVDSGIVCPGFENKKPLVWVTPGKVTHRAQQRPRRKRAKSPLDAPKSKEAASATPTAAPVPETAIVLVDRSVTIKHDSPLADFCLADVDSVSGGKSEQASWRSLTPGDDYENLDIGRELALNRRSSLDLTWSNFHKLYKAQQQANNIPASLWVEDYELIGAVDYWMNRVYAPWVRRQVVPSSHTTANITAAEVIPSLLSQCRRHTFMAMIVAHQTFNTNVQLCSATQAVLTPPSRAVNRFYRHVGLAIQGLNLELSSHKGTLDAGLFTSVWWLLGAEACQSMSNGTQAHVNGMLAMIDVHGGLGKFMSLQAPRWSGIQAFIVSCVLTFTSSPPNHQLVRVSHMDMDDLHRLYNWTAVPDFLCPSHLFLDIIRINRLRFQCTKEPFILEHGSCSQNPLQDILTDIWAFSPEQWRLSSGYLHEDQVLVIGRIFQYSVALYAISSLQDSVGAFHLVDEGNAETFLSKDQIKKLLFAHVELGMGSLYVETMGWPLAVAGAIATEPSERAAVEKNLDTHIGEVGFGTSVRFLPGVLKEHWASGKTGWNDCFKDPYYMM